MKENSPIVLVILDGWGHGTNSDYNAIHLARTTNMDRWQEEYPFTTLVAHNGMVGLPEGQMGNSEVGHLNIGAGRVVYQDYTRINKAISTGELANNEALNSLINKTIKKGSALHLMGLVSDGGVHSHLSHLTAIVDTAAQKGLKKIYIHCFMDGRDTPPNSGKNHIDELEKSLKQIGSGSIVTVAGRYYAMDRDNRWDRVQKAWQVMVDDGGPSFESASLAMEHAYEEGQTDEFVMPVNILDANGKLNTINDGDSVLFFNFRADRARQMTHVFTDENFKEFSCYKRPKILEFVTCTRYEKNLKVPVLFPPVELRQILGEEISRHKLSQLRIAETEKYAHVTYFFNGGREAVFEGEDRILIESPRDVATYDLKPEMSAIELTDALLERLAEKKYDLIVLNYANGDMVGHTGDLAAAIKACEVVDGCLGRLVASLKETGAAVMITSDHGNADILYDQDNKTAHTAHSLSPVPFILISEQHKDKKLRSGGALKEIAPTILTLMNLPVPKEMEGESLI